MIGRKYVLANSTGSLAHSDRLTARNRQSGVRDATWGPLCVISCEWRRSRVHAVASHGHSQQVNKAADTPRDIVRGQVVRRRTGVRTIEAELLNTTQCASTQNKQTTSPRFHQETPQQTHTQRRHRQLFAEHLREGAVRNLPFVYVRSESAHHLRHLRPRFRILRPAIFNERREDGIALWHVLPQPVDDCATGKPVVLARPRS